MESRENLVARRKGELRMVSFTRVGDWTDNFLSGASASLLSKVILQPFDTSKTLLQAERKVRGNYTNLSRCIVGLVQSKGLGALYTGFLASIAVSAPSSAVFAAGYEFSKNWIEKAAVGPWLPLLQLAPVLAAAFGNVAASIVRVPPEIIKQRVQAGIYRNVFEATRSVWVTEGLAGFYLGYSAMLARDIPYSALQFMTFEALKKRRQRILQRNSTPSSNTGRDIMSDLWMGAIAGALASSLTTPLDVVKTRVMTQTSSGRLVYGIRDTVKNIWLEEGVVGFGRGMVPRVLYKVPASAVFLVCYEAMKRLLSTARKNRHIMRSRNDSLQNNFTECRPNSASLRATINTSISASTPL